MGAILLFLTALIWGCAFLFQKLGGDHVGPFAFTVYRNVLAGLFLLGVMAARRRLAFGRGEALTLLCAVFYAGQILVVDHFVTKADVLALSCVQFFTGAVLGLPFLALPSEAVHLNFADIRAACIAIAFCGVLSSGVAYTLQNVGQKLVSPAIAGILLSLESVFGVFFGWLAWTCGWLSTPEEMTPRRLAGYALVFAAILFTQLLDARRAVRATA